MKNNKITLKEAEKFHGHLGPWLILGVRAGEFALKKLRCKKFFDIEVKVRGASEKPRSCLIDGLQFRMVAPMRVVGENDAVSFQLKLATK